MNSNVAIVLCALLAIVAAKSGPSEKITGIWMPKKCTIDGSEYGEDKFKGVKNNQTYVSGTPASMTYTMEAGDGEISGQVAFSDTYSATCEKVKDATEEGHKQYLAMAMKLCGKMSAISFTDDNNIYVSFGDNDKCSYKKNSEWAIFGVESQITRKLVMLQFFGISR